MTHHLLIPNRHGHQYRYEVNTDTHKVIWTGTFERALSRSIQGVQREKIISVDPAGGPRIAIHEPLTHIHSDFFGLTVSNIVRISPTRYELTLAPVKKFTEDAARFSVRDHQFKKLGVMTYAF